MNNPLYNSRDASFLGILEGKAKARKEAAAAEAAAKIEEAKRQTLALEALAASKGYTPVADENQAKLDQLNAGASGEKTLYYVLAGIVVAVMVGLYFIKRK